MKKGFIILCVLLILGSAAFAQQDGWKMSGFLYTTMGYNPVTNAWAGQSVIIDGAVYTMMYYTRIVANYTRGNYGFTIGANIIEGFDRGDVNWELFSMNMGFGTGFFFDKQLEVQIGKVFDTKYNSGGRLSMDGGEGPGFYLHYKPAFFDGFSISAGVFAPDGGGEFKAAKFTFGTLYEIPRVFKVTGALSIKNYEVDRFSTGITYTGVNNLRTQFEIAGMKSANTDRVWAVIDQIVQYRMSDLTVGIYGYQFINNANRYASKSRDNPIFSTIPVPENQIARLGWSVDPWFSYRIGMITPRLTCSVESYGNQEYMVTGLLRERERMSFSATPSIALQLGMMGQITLDYKFVYHHDTTAIDGVAADPTATKFHTISLTSAIVF